MPLGLTALLSDILWTQKRDYKASQIAAQSYFELFKTAFSKKEYHESLNHLRRAVCISTQTNSKSIYAQLYTWFCNFITNDAMNIDLFISIRIMELFFENKNTDVSLIIPVIDNIISLNGKDVLLVEQAYKLKAQCFYRLKKDQDAIQTNVSLAKYYFEYAEKLVSSNGLEALRADAFYKKAVNTYRNNGESEKAETVHRRLVEVQKTIPQSMHTLFLTFDTHKAIDNITNNMAGLTFEECIVRLTQYIGFESYEDLKKRTIKEHKQDITKSLFATGLLNAEGQTIIKIAPLDDTNPESDMELLKLHMFQNALRVQRIIGDIWVRNCIHYIRSAFEIRDDMLDFLTSNNCIIPEGRSKIFRNALGLFLRGEYYEALHILAPQMENLFRYIAKESGSLTTTLEDKGIQKVYLLKSVFALPELLDSYDNDILFAFRGLLNEQASANIRNKIAHGIIEEIESASGECLFFGALVIKLLSLTSHTCNEILATSERIKNFIIPSSRDVTIIDRKKT